MSNSPKEKLLDVQGLMCPEPLRLVRLQLQQLIAGQVLRVLATDPAAHIDIESWCLRSGHEFLDGRAKNGTWNIRVRKSAGRVVDGRS